MLDISFSRCLDIVTLDCRIEKMKLVRFVMCKTKTQWSVLVHVHLSAWCSTSVFDTLLTLQEYPPGQEDRGLQKEPLKTVKDGKRVYYDSIKV